MKRVWFSLRNQIRTMANIPPRKNSPTSKPSKQDASPLQILLQMGFPRHRALKALAATGNRSVQLASDWLLTHVNDTYIDADEPREYILYANPTGALLTQLHDFWAKSKKLGGWNGAHNFPPHITLISFFKAPDETSLQLAKAVKTVIETVGDPPGCPLKLDPYISQNFMGLFVSEEHAEYLKKIAVQYVKQVSSLCVSGYLPAVFTRRTAESDAWTLHRAISLGNNSGSDCKSESDSNTDGEMAGYPHEDATQLGHDKSEEVYKEWQKYWEVVMTEHKSDSIVNVTQGTSIDWKSNSQGTGEGEAKAKPDRRWFFTMRHGERVDLTYGSWVPFCFDEAGNYVRKDLNMPLTLGDRVGGSGSYSKDTPLTRVGRLQASLVGEGLRLAQQPISHVYASAALRCVETAHCMLEGYQNPSLKVKVEPGLFEFKNWYLSKGGMAPFMTPQELHKTGLNVDLTYTPYIDLDITTSETLEEFYKRNELVMHSAVKDTEEKGGNIMFIGHAATLDIMVLALKRLAAGGEHEHEHEREHEPYTLHPHLLRVPYCALGAMRDRPWQVVSPPCPPSINSSSGRFDWRILQDL
ncbi:ecdysteroid-phosphate phosphatase isoform X3 [Leguminivora glycinivorella]|uniref:ecdysteroid-phosphate phosphatase isoform X3 n=1 Tax=Leguminivora glycinivorella TaxID=1035111 RepID=UPI00200C7AF6|nr:ecdysteroid-phosphate phosphatase isoform X3 [Leguminivora glycinivorella]